jgi:hypothetical protein
MHRYIVGITYQPKNRLSTVGARVDDVGLGGPLWSPAVGWLKSFD